MNDPDYIVIRPAPECPPGFLPPSFDGRWYDLADMPQPLDPEAAQGRAVAWGGMAAVPIGRFEIRDYDGAVAAVYEVGP